MANECFYIYILYSSVSDVYYVGYSDDPVRRLTEHNTKPFNTYTSKHRPWILKAYFLCRSKSDAIRMERFIKKQKSRHLIKRLVDPCYTLTDTLAQMVRVPHLRD